MDTDRRTVLRLLAAGPVAAGFTWTEAEAQQAHDHAQTAQAAAKKTGAPYKPKFFTPHEWATVNVLVDIIIPKDERSGSATDAKAPEFIDFMLMDKETSEGSRVGMRGGLAWLDSEHRRRFNTDFLGANDAQRRAVLDDIAYPKKAKPEFAPGVNWFNRFRSNVGSAFFSSAMGWQDLRYMGNVFNPNWNGCPPEATRKLGVSYEEYDASLARNRKA
jgi:gluconate 2-dehydrogenase gamma chain